MNFSPVYSKQDRFAILGIDPGSQRFGAAAMLSGGAEPPEWVGLYCVRVRGASFAHRLGHIERELRALYAVHAPAVVAWEAPFYHHGTRNADACIQLSKAVGVGERLLPEFAGIAAGYECQPSSSRRALGVGQGNYFLLREALSRLCPAAASALSGGLDLARPHDRQPGATVPCDTVSAMVQAWALHALLAEGIERRGIEQVYCRTAPRAPGGRGRRKRTATES